MVAKNTAFNSIVGGSQPLSALTTDGPGTTQINAASVNTTGAQVYGDSVALGVHVTLSGSAVSFASTVDSAGVSRDLVVNAAATSFMSHVGASQPLGNLLTLGAGTTTFGLVGGQGTLTASADVTFNAAVVLEGTWAMTAEDVSFNSTLDGQVAGNSGLTPPAMGQMYFGGSVGGVIPLASISVGPNGTTFFSAHPMNDPTVVTTFGAQNYQNLVKLLGHVTLDSLNNGNISLLGGVEGDQMSGQNLTINTGGVTEFGSIGAGVPLGVLTTDALGSTTIDASFVGLGGPTVFLDPVTLLQEVNIQQLGVGDVVFQSTLDSDATARGLFYFAPQGSAFLFVQAVGGSSPLDYLGGSGELTIAAPLVKTLGSQFFGAAVYFDESSELLTTGSAVSFGDVHVIENAHVVVDTGDGAGNITLEGNAFGDAGGVLETMTLRAGAGEARVRGVVAPSIQIIIETAPVIVRQPVGLTAAEGDDLTLSVAAIGSDPLQYQWRKDGSPIPAAFGAALTVSGATVADSGVFTVIVSNDAGSATSAGATVDVLTPPTIDTQPVSQSVSFGASTMFSVVASGSPTLRFQWRFNGQNIPGATSSTLGVSNVQAADLGRYTVIVQNDVGAVTSAPAELSVALPALSVALTPESAPTQTESSASKSVAILDDSTYFMRWQAPDTGIATFDTKGSGYDTRMTVYAGGTLGGLQRIASDDDSGGFLTSEIQFNVVSGMVYTIEIEGVEGGFGQLVVNWSFEASAREAPLIVTQPESRSAPFGGSAALTVVATGSAPLSYQWRHNGMDIPGATSSSLTVDDIEAADLGQYVAVVSNDVGSVRARPAHIDAGSNPAVISRSKFENPAGGAAALQFGRGRRQNLVVAAGALGTQVFNNTQSVTEPGEPNHGNAIGGSSRWFEITASEDGTLLVDTIGSEIDTAMAIYTGSSLATLALVAQDNDGAPDGIRSQVSFVATKDTTYTIAVDGVGGATGLINLNWLLGAPPVITMAPADLLVNRLEGAAFEASATGNPAPTFSWQFIGNNLAGATTEVLSLVDIEPEDAGIYTVTASNAFGSVSASAELIVDNPLRFEGMPVIQPDGSFAVTLVGPVNATTGISIVLEATADFETWTQVATATSMDGMFSLMEANAEGHGARYYRVRLNTGD